MAARATHGISSNRKQRIAGQRPPGLGQRDAGCGRPNCGRAAGFAERREFRPICPTWAARR
eukprot:11227238-Lingulodinium_polyedra.AAC.1